ncbi:MAG: alpha-amylase family glycosyl hydrolase [Candidatus Gallimonas sp.]
MVTWLKDSVFYQIYPTSFYDSNGDGIGDFNGIVEKLGYIKELGVNAIWLNPFYPSPFMDGGYDVSDYRAVDPRFGTLEDFCNLVSACKREGIRVVIDLVIGHTSVEHEWFKSSASDQRNRYSDYYIWTDNNLNKYRDRTIHGLYPRDGGYYINYYACQPALNYGFNDVEEGRDEEDSYSLGTRWQMHYTDERLEPLRREILGIMRFWLKTGIDGFRVDLANSLVKGCVYNSDDDADTKGLQWLWKRLLDPIRAEYPECVFISEWVYAKNAVGKCGFDVDFYSHDIVGYNDLFRNEKGSNLLPTFERGANWFSRAGQGTLDRFLTYYLDDLDAVQGKGYVSVPTGSHDQVRLSKSHDVTELKAIYAFLLTLKHVPFLYYGDEIGLSHGVGLNKDGGYVRTGARTPMQWTNGKNRGFSDAEEIYLPVNDAEEQSVDRQIKDENSLLSMVKRLIALRKEKSCLNADGKFETVSVGENGYPFVYRRSDANGELIVAINACAGAARIPSYGKVLLSENARQEGDAVVLTGIGFAIMDGKSVEEKRAS